MSKRLIRLVALTVLMGAGVMGAIALTASPAEARGNGCLNYCKASGGSMAQCRSQCGVGR